MTKIQSTLSKSVILFFTAMAFSACGVRGKPQPPLTPAELGRGQPTFKRATEEFAFPNVPSPEATPRAKKSRGSTGDSDED